MANSSKGSSFERDICKQLSLWWTDGQRDDVFWRTAMSGGRATVRGRQGKSTYGQHGDVQATDPIGIPLTRVCSIELKRGYSGHTFADLMEKPDGPSMWREFIKQARRGSKGEKTPYWLLIVKRDRREALILFPNALYNELCNFCPETWFESSTYDKLQINVRINKRIVRMRGMRLKDFILRAPPSSFKEIYDRHEKTKTLLKEKAT